MFQLYKQRNFSGLINDTFGFFKAYGKSFFKGYFIINGGLLLVLMVLMYLVGKVFLDAFFSSINNPNGGGQIIEEYFNSNAGLFIAASILGGIIILLLTLLSHSYPVIFLKLLEKKRVPEVKEILNTLWSKIGRLVTFSLLWLVTFLPIIILASLLSMVLFIIVIGIPFAIIVIAGVMSWMYLSLFDYINNNTGYFDAMKNGFNLLFQNFWPHVGSTAIFYLIVTIIHSIISFIPYFIGIFGLIADTTRGETPGQDTFSFLSLMMIITFMLSLLFAYVLSNLMIVNQGIIYYSAREENENMSLHSEIDLIGRDGE